MCAPEQAACQESYQKMKEGHESGSVDLREAQWPQDCALMVGSESFGLPDEALALCQFAIHIPICGPLKSLNVSHALAIALFDATYRPTEHEPAGTSSAQSQNLVRPNE